MLAYIWTGHLTVDTCVIYCIKHLHHYIAFRYLIWLIDILLIVWYVFSIYILYRIKAALGGPPWKANFGHSVKERFPIIKQNLLLYIIARELLSIYKLNFNFIIKLTEYLQYVKIILHKIWGCRIQNKYEIHRW